MKTIAVLGSTGSIGRQTLDVVRAFPDEFRIAGLAAGNNIELLISQVECFRPAAVSSSVLPGNREATQRLAALGAEICTPEELASLAQIDLVVVATSGKAGLAPTFAALRSGKPLALANKEVLVMAGQLVREEADKRGLPVLPVDSEHSALWQCLRGEGPTVSRLILTASGGPFRNRSLAELARVTAAEALNHPTWQMGRKVTVDSATLMNKGLEIIEARWLFGIPLANIQVVIHPESIIHSMVEFVDGSMKAQMSYPDMRLPIQCALSYPGRLRGGFVPPLDFSRTKNLSFAEPDFTLFPCPRLAMEASRRGGTYPAVLCAADEVAVDLFLKGRIGFLDIPRIVEMTIERHSCGDKASLEEIDAADIWARAMSAELAGALR